MSANFNPATMAEARQFTAANAASATPTNIYKVNRNVGAQRDVVENVNFPVRMGTSDPDDYKYALQGKLVNQEGKVPHVGQAIVGPEYFEYVERKMDVAQQVEFEDWLMKQVDWSTPEATEYWVRMFPWMLERRLEEVNRVSDLQKVKAKINIAGPQTAEDWRFMWNEQRGLIKVPDKPVHVLPETSNMDYNNKDYARGMFSPMINYIPPFNGAGLGNPAHKPNAKISWQSPTNYNAGNLSQRMGGVNFPVIAPPNNLGGYLPN